jgi:SAM-dependent methyltransferase
MSEPQVELTLADYPRRYCPVCSRTVRKEFRRGPGGRPDAGCPRCGSLERHRFLAVLLGVLRPSLGDIDVLLDVAPTPRTTPMLAELGPRRQVRLDLGADRRQVDVQGDLTALPIADGSIDLLVCYHVLEHVPADRSAMAEIARVLAPRGTALLQVPWRPGTVTDEDPAAPVEERIARFGQHDHVRYYGDDFETRLMEAGLSLRRITPGALLGERMCSWMKILPHEAVWVARPADGEPIRELGLDTLRVPAVWEALIEQLLEQRARGNRLRARAQRLRAQKQRLEARGPSNLAPPGRVARLRRALRRG